MLEYRGNLAMGNGCLLTGNALKGAGHAVSAIETSAKPTPRVLRRHRAAQRQASNQAT
jgi:hypothetical protein